MGGGSSAAHSADGARLVLLGPPNSGKGTQAKALAARLGIPAISTGEMLRGAVAARTEIGRRAESIMAAGQLVDDETMAGVVRERLRAEDAAAGYLLDGYPRTLPQADHLDEILTERGEDLDAVILLEVPDETLSARALGRGRPDDRKEVLRERLAVYRADTAPLADRYRRQGLLETVDGDRSVAEVTREIVAVVSGEADRQAGTAG